MKINSGGNLRGIINTTYTCAKAENSLIIPTDLNLEIWVACSSKNDTPNWPVRSSFNPKNRRPKAPPFFVMWPDAKAENLVWKTGCLDVVGWDVLELNYMIYTLEG